MKVFCMSLVFVCIIACMWAFPRPSECKLAIMDSGKCSDDSFHSSCVANRVLRICQ